MEGSRHTSGKARVLIVDDHALLRQGLRGLIEQEDDLEVCGEAPDARTALELIEAERPNLAIVDLGLEDLHGLDLIGQLTARYPGTVTLVLSMHDENLYAERCLRAGASGYVQKREAPGTVIAAIRTVLAGGVHVSQALTGRILHRVADRGDEPEGTALSRLTDRELQLLELMGQGLTTREVAKRLHLSEKTIHTHRESLKSKLDLDNLYQLTRFAVAWNLG
jgi:DNA-binding NarL/FixJ family response regulator